MDLERNVASSWYFFQIFTHTKRENTDTVFGLMLIILNQQGWHDENMLRISEDLWIFYCSPVPPQGMDSHYTIHHPSSVWVSTWNSAASNSCKSVMHCRHSMDEPGQLSVLITTIPIWFWGDIITAKNRGEASNSCFEYVVALRLRSTRASCISNMHTNQHL